MRDCTALAFYNLLLLFLLKKITFKLNLINIYIYIKIQIRDKMMLFLALSFFPCQHAKQHCFALSHWKYTTSIFWSDFLTIGT